LYRLGRWRKLDATGASLGLGLSWNNPMFACQIAPGAPDTWQFPAGYPFT
jgi:hypothetical protein